MDKQQVLRMNTAVLAYVGDAVYEVAVRQWVVSSGISHTDKLHRLAVRYVSAYGQARVMKAIVGELSEEEFAVVKRARNHKISSKPKNVDPMTYKDATALEALIGYLHLAGKDERKNAILDRARNIIEE